MVANIRQYDSFLFGASTVGSLNVSGLTEGLFYNMSYSEGVPKEFLDDLKYFVSKGVKIKHLVIGLDDFSYKINPEVHRGQFMRHPYDRSGFKRAIFLLRYLFSPVSVQRAAYLFALADKIRFQMNAREIVYDLYKTGNLTLVGADVLIEQNAEAHRKKEDFLHARIYRDRGRLQKTIEELREISQIAKANNMRVTVFISPIHQTTYLNINHEYFFEFKRKLAGLFNYYDFSGLNAIATDNYYFYETSHYRPLVGDMMIARIFEKNPSGLPEDFGFFVTKDNVEDHLLYLKTELMEKAGEGKSQPVA